MFSFDGNELSVMEWDATDREALHIVQALMNHGRHRETERKRVRETVKRQRMSETERERERWEQAGGRAC